MVNYNRLGYEIKRDLANFSSKVSKGLKRPTGKIRTADALGILEGNKPHLSEIGRSLKENISLKRTTGHAAFHLIETQYRSSLNFLTK